MSHESWSRMMSGRIQNSIVRLDSLITGPGPSRIVSSQGFLIAAHSCFPFSISNFHFQISIFKFPISNFHFSSLQSHAMTSEQDGLIVDGRVTRRRSSSCLWPCLWSFLGLCLVVTLITFSIKAMSIGQSRHAASLDARNKAKQITNTDNRNYDDSGLSNFDAAQQMNRLNALDPPPHVGCESTVFLVRHCEKDLPTVDDNPQEQHCSYLGLERAHFLTTLFGTRWPIPTHLYALSASRSDHDNFREIETLQPLAHYTNISINHQFTTRDTADLASDLFSRLRDSCGKLSVIAWKHSAMPELARALGCSTCPDEYPQDNYDQVWQLKYLYRYDSLNENHNSSLRRSRHLHNKNHNAKKRDPTSTWALYSSVVEQRFDPLEFSFRSGNYPHAGVESGGNRAHGITMGETMEKYNDHNHDHEEI